MTFRTKFLLVCFDLRPPNNPITACGATSFPGYHSFPKWAMVSHLDSLWNRGMRELGNGLRPVCPSRPILDPSTSLFRYLISGFIGVTCISMCSNNSYVAVLRTQSMFWLLNQSISKENLEYSFRYSNVVFEDLWTQPANICRGNSLFKITRCICEFNFYAWNSSNNRNRHLSLTRLTEITLFASAMERASRPVGILEPPLKFSNLSSETFGWMDRSQVTFLWLPACLFVCCHLPFRNIHRCRLFTRLSAPRKSPKTK